MKIPNKSYLAEKLGVFTVLFLILNGLWWINFGQFDVSPVQVKPKSNPSRFSPLDQNPRFRKMLELQSAFIRNAKNVRPSVVSINEFKKIRYNNTHEPFSNNVFSFLKFKLWLTRTLDRRYTMKSLGSGLILNSSGHILTSYRVVRGVNKLIIRLARKKEFQTRVLGYDLLSDLAVLKIFSIANFPKLEIGNSSNLAIGEWVMAIGNPYGLEGSISVGVISGKQGVHGWDYLKYLQTDTSINPGNSGGPLINLDGKVIGINTESNQQQQGMGLTLPIEVALSISSKLIERGTADRGWLGISIQNLDKSLVKIFKFSQNQHGVLVNHVEDKTPASKAGLKRGDIITQFDGKKILNYKNFQEKVLTTPIGKSVLLTLIRNRDTKTLTVKIGKMNPEFFYSEAIEGNARLV